jgi:hypothetical protein
MKRAGYHESRDVADGGRLDRGQGASGEVSRAGSHEDHVASTEPSSPFDETTLEEELSAAESKRNWRISKASPYVPIFISVLALCSSIYSALETRIHDRLSAAPFTSFLYRVDEGADEVGLYYQNTGLGPAVVSSMRVYFDGKRINDFRNVVDSTRILYLGSAPIWDYDISYDFDFMIPPNVDKKIFYIKPSSLRTVRGFEKMLKSRLFVIVYTCSMYGDCEYNCSTVGDEECRAVEIHLDPNSAQIKPVQKR